MGKYKKMNSDRVMSYKKLLFPIIFSLIIFTLLNFWGLSNKQSCFLSVVFFLIYLWTSESLPLGLISLLPIIFFPIFGITSLKEVCSNYSNPIVYLFLGGFLVAIAIEKTKLHQFIAYKTLSFFPSSPRGVLYSVMITTGLLSSFLSDTTTTLLLIPVAACLTTERSLRIRLFLGVAHASMIGGIITPLGTPPNLILLGFLEENSPETINFAKWVLMMLPLAIPALIFSAEILLFGMKKDLLVKKIEIDNKLNKEQKKLIIILLSLIILIVLNPLFKALFSFQVNEKILFLSFGLLLFLPKVNILKWEEDIPKVSWGIIFLIGASLSIAMGFSKTHLSELITTGFSYIDNINPAIFIIIVVIAIVFLTELTSNTGLSAIAIPIVYTIALQQNFNPLLLTLTVAICASYAFMLPTATFPNAIVLSTGELKVAEMIKRGIWLNLLNIILTSIYANFYWKLFI